MNTAQRSIQQYINAKDGNRPHLLDRAFTPDAVLDMNVRTGTISFPGHVEGRAAIGDVLVRRFGQTFENVYTFCLGTTPAADANAFQCKWLVAMSDKNSGEARVGCGGYDWRFNPQSRLAEHLTITIEHMKTLPATDLPAIMAWVSGLDYPWCSPEAAISEVPDLGELHEVIQYVTSMAV
ncbi:nuclear transport factor 2 family protein [Pseudomonas sp. Tri1]|uniref:nuclear transport factor 2 family protein n=1 Tax=Pseudomonas sp. Tri1 TaxID=2823875 RepID=UPI001B32ECA3|nr:nuclear transport factor 2 family protein [Pseudomonas sp. Tri1]